MTICPKHRDSLGTRWRSGKTVCSIPAKLPGHKKADSRGDRGINSKRSQLVLEKSQNKLLSYF